MGPFVILPSRDLVTVEDSDDATHAMISRDGGKTWEKIPIFAEPGRFPTAASGRSFARVRER